MADTRDALEALVTALERRTARTYGAAVREYGSPSMGNAFVRAWLALDRNPDDIPGEWQDQADTFADIG